MQKKVLDALSADVQRANARAVRIGENREKPGETFLERSRARLTKTRQALAGASELVKRSSTNVKLLHASLKRVSKLTASLANESEHREALVQEQTDALHALTQRTDAFQEDVLRRYYELLKVKDPLFAENVFMYGSDHVPSAASRFSPTLFEPQGLAPLNPGLVLACLSNQMAPQPAATPDEKEQKKEERKVAAAAKRKAMPADRPAKKRRS